MAKVLVSESNLTAIADAIREKNGETTTYKPSEMASAITAIEDGGSGVWDALIHGQSTEVIDAGLITCSEIGSLLKKGLTSLSLPCCTAVEAEAFREYQTLKTVSLPECVDIADKAFAGCNKLSSLDLPVCESIEGSDSTLSVGAFSATALTNVSLPRCETIGAWAFYECTQLLTANLPACVELGTGSFMSCTSLNYINLPACRSIGSYAFTSIPIEARVHLSIENLDSLRSAKGYSSRWGRGNDAKSKSRTTFDLNAAMLSIVETDSAEAMYIDGEAFYDDPSLSPSETEFYLSVNQAHEFIAIREGYRPIIETIAPNSTDAINKSLAFTTDGVTYAINLPFEGTVSFSHNGISLGTGVGTAYSCIVPTAWDVDYIVIINGYKAIHGTIQSDGDYTVTITADELEERVGITYDYSYPFTDNDGMLENLVDGTSFEISASPTPYSSTVTRMASSIVSCGTGNNNAVRFGYILFHTPCTTDTEQLTVSVTCNAYAESSYDTGIVFIDKTLHKVTSMLRFSAASSGSDSDTYGHILYNSYGRSSSSYETYTYTLEADTDYYLHFVYTTDSSNSNYWDRLSITNIKFTHDLNGLTTTASLDDGLVSTQELITEEVNPELVIEEIKQKIIEYAEAGDTEMLKELTAELEALQGSTDAGIATDEEVSRPVTD